MKARSRRPWIWLLVVVAFSVVLVVVRFFLHQAVQVSTEVGIQMEAGLVPKAIAGETLLGIVETQLSYGPRYIGSSGHTALRTMLKDNLAAVADEVVVQNWEHKSRDGTVDELENIIARFSPEASQRILLAAHYDTRRYADRDTEHPQQPVPGANDGASGVAVLLGLARALGADAGEHEVGIDIVFFDGEEGELVGHSVPWVPLGSTHFSANLSTLYTPESLPLSGVVVDMVCEHNITLPMERNSLQQAGEQTVRLWEVGSALYPEVFLRTVGKSIGDDHTPLNTAGIPTVLVIDFEYPEWHTVDDTIDRCSSTSLEAVAHTLLTYLRDMRAVQ